jgi:hypothetical protein
VPSRPPREEDPALEGTGAADSLGSITATAAAPGNG